MQKGVVAVASLTAAVLSSGCHISISGQGWGWSCDETMDLETTADLDGVSRVRVVARAGSLDIEGGTGGTGLRAFGTACASSRSILDEVELVAEREGDTLVVETRLPDRSRLDLSVRLPEHLPIEVEDSSGSLRIERVGALVLDDASGSATIETVAGDVRIRDGSGSLDIESVDGDVVVEHDGSGSIEIREVTGDVLIEEDGSGGITIVDVAGGVRVLEDGSGSVRTDRIAGDVEL